MTDTIITEKEKVEEINKQSGDTIRLSFKNKKGIFMAEGEIDSVQSRVYVKFINESISKLHATVKPIIGQGNIRFNQIIFPDKTSDGPFGQEAQIDLKQTGEHTLVIGHSLMADGQYQGKFKIELQLSE